MNAQPVRTRHLFVLSLDSFNREMLESVDIGAPLVLHQLLDIDQVTSSEDFDVAATLAEAERQLKAHDGPIDGIMGYWDFPVSLMVPILARRFGQAAPSVHSVVGCEHKYYSRLLQSQVAPEHVPEFQAVDPFDEADVDGIRLEYPFWIKPVKSFSSHLGFRVANRKDLDHAIGEIRAGITDIGNAFNDFLALADLPPDAEKIGGNHCVVEQLIGGRQCTLEGFVQGGRVEVYGVVDSLRFANRSTFSRYQYPSRLPRWVKEKMIEIAQRVLGHVGLDHSAFNMEFFWQPRDDRIWILEINPRISQSHGDIFEKVDGSPNHLIPVELALGHAPSWRRGQGSFGSAAKVFWRHFSDARVVRVPNAGQIEVVEQRFPGTRVHVEVREGMRLSDLDEAEQDSYSYCYAIIFAGASSGRRLRENLREIRDMLGFEFQSP